MSKFDHDLEDRVWRLRYVSRWTLRHIAHRVGVSLGTVHNLLKRRALRLASSHGLRATGKLRAISLNDARDLDWNSCIAKPAGLPRKGRRGGHTFV